eukprot:CAMPEP_0168317508 /NCGR_PEP_ID=MMETSP0210-20121227/25766_1 /TAXON_ID=40633 /ORGANISM="Condylostoma magnum, Strain COL2" /LENGTH=111 /DNA_ID=CAMNT_0008317645 /DNA_START=1599 /DNA_END=1934 /DNA_ORIENTATION=-
MTTVGSTILTITVDNTNPIVLSNNNPSEAADYTFNFSSAAELVEGDEIWIQFPREYSPYVGWTERRYEWFEPSRYYIDCNPGDLGVESECVADHWYVKVIGSNGVSAGTNI